MKKLICALLFLHSSGFVFSTPDTWLQKTSLPAQPRLGAVAFAISGYGYIGTGLDSSGNFHNDFWRYDATNDSWTQVADFAGSARKNAVAFVTDSFTYVGTGYDNSGITNDFYKYDAVNNLWQQVTALTNPTAARDAAAFNIGNKGYVVGGYDGTTFYSNKNWEYDAARDTAWMQQLVFPVAGRRWATSFSIAGFGFVGMGYNYSQEYFADLWEFDINTNTWTQMANYPGNKRGNAVAFVLGLGAYVGTGFDGTLKDDFFVYNYTDNSWSSIATFAGNPTSGAVAFALNGKGYVFGGGDSLGYKNELWEYTPAVIAGIGDSEFKVEDEVILAPNPANEEFTVHSLKFKTESKSQIKLYDSEGKLALRKNISSKAETISVKELPRGTYYYCVISSSEKTKTVTGKLVLE